MIAQISPYNLKADFKCYSQRTSFADLEAGKVALDIPPSYTRHKVWYAFSNVGNSKLRGVIRFTYHGNIVFDLPINHDLNASVTNEWKLRIARYVQTTPQNTSLDYMEGLVLKPPTGSAQVGAVQHNFSAIIDKAQIVTFAGSSATADIRILLAVFSDNAL